MTETISVIIPTYQHADTIVRCLESIFAQTRKPDEIIVVDDGSTDETQTVLKPYLDRVKNLVQINAGAPTARNNGFAASTGSLVMFCDADLDMQPTMIEQLEKALIAHPEASFAYSSFKWGWKAFSSYPFDTKKLRQMNYIHTSALIRRKDFPGFDPALKRFQDWDLWLTMSEQGKVGTFVNQTLFTVIQEDRPERMSNWLPSVIIRFPWHRFGWVPKGVKKYQAAKRVIQQKHHLV